MSRAVLRVDAKGSSSLSSFVQPTASSRANAALRSNVRRSGPADRRKVSVGQSQCSGVLRPMKRGSIPMRS
jgi:hypothetical protein